MKLKWNPVRNRAIQQAEKLGHSLGAFRTHSGAHPLKMASCLSCLGCCWIAHSPTRGFMAGGRLLKYKCGTAEAGGYLVVNGERDKFPSAIADTPQTRTEFPQASRGTQQRGQTVTQRRIKT